MNQLCLSLRKEWYGLIQIGRKTEEYREIKPYWIKRFFVHADGTKITNSEAFIYAEDVYALFRAVGRGKVIYVDYTHVKFSYGYTRRTMTFEVKDIRISRGRVEWGAPLAFVIVIELGKKIASSNED